MPATEGISRLTEAAGHPFYGLWPQHYEVALRAIAHRGPLSTEEVGRTLLRSPISQSVPGDASRNTGITERATAWLQVAEWIVEDAATRGFIADRGGWVLVDGAEPRVYADSQTLDLTETEEVVHQAGARASEYINSLIPFDNPFAGAWRDNLPGRSVDPDDVALMAEWLEDTRDVDGHVRLDARIVMDETGGIIDGHLRAQALDALGIVWMGDERYVDRRTYGVGREANVARIADALRGNVVHRPLSDTTLRAVARWLRLPVGPRPEGAAARRAQVVEIGQGILGLIRTVDPSARDVIRGRFTELAMEPVTTRPGRGRPRYLPDGQRGYSLPRIAEMLAEEFGGDPIPQQTLNDWLHLIITGRLNTATSRDEPVIETAEPSRPPSDRQQEVLDMVKATGASGLTRPELIATAGRDPGRELSRLVQAGNLRTISERVDGQRRPVTRYYDPEHAPPEAETRVASSPVDATVPCPTCGGSGRVSRA